MRAAPPIDDMISAHPDGSKGYNAVCWSSLRAQPFSAPVGIRGRVADATPRFLYNEPFRKRRLMYMVYPRFRFPQIRLSQQKAFLDGSSLGTLALQTAR